LKKLHKILKNTVKQNEKFQTPKNSVFYQNFNLEYITDIFYFQEKIFCSRPNPNPRANIRLKPNPSINICKMLPNFILLSQSPPSFDSPKLHFFNKTSIFRQNSIFQQ